MATITFKGDPVHTVGELPETGGTAPELNLANSDLADVGLADFAGKILVLNIVPSLDTSVCLLSAKRFAAEAAERPDTVFLTISRDLPFAMSRVCQAENIEGIQTLSSFRNPSFGTDYGAEIADGPLKGLLSRAVVVVGPDHRVLYREQVPDIAREPDYDAALAALPR